MLALYSLLLLFSSIPGSFGFPADEKTCSRVCTAQDLTSLSLKYGKYCGVGYSGCEGEPPCDAYDRCCKRHDKCVGSSGISESDLACHDVFKKCLAKAEAKGEASFSNDVDVSALVKTMSQGMDLASMFAGMMKKPSRGEEDM
jgi:hypothetical protein